MEKKRIRVSVKGVVQGVGFRPFVYKLASGLDLKGFIKNTSEGVAIEVEGYETDEFIRQIQAGKPPLASIDALEVKEMPYEGYEGFDIVDSSPAGSFTLVPPDISICDDCREEMFDPSDRRYLYPFINCTDCGPRYSITRGIPYDRSNTTMSVFDMCPHCLAEYDEPSDRRFHAQPNACPECGPQLELRVISSGFGGGEDKDPIRSTIGLLKQGAIVAVKGLGGFHLCCDAENEGAVKKLREKKRRSNKPFALMSLNVETIRKYCEVSEEERSLLEDIRRPIVLLRRRSEDRIFHSLPPFEIAPNNRYLGFMLPYTPLHYLLFYCPSAHNPSPMTHHFNALVMTSANLAEEPIVTGNEEAVSKLAGIADAFLLHNRDIFMRVDDSVVKTRQKTEVGSRTFIRRSRGYVPEPILIEEDGPDVLGCGADLKNTFAMTKGNYAIVSQHIGDMENLETLRFFEESLANLMQAYGANPVAIAHDLHPGYLSTQWAKGQKTEDRSRKSEEQNSKLITQNSELFLFGVQHHWAHIASVMAERSLKDKVIGVAFDGTGYGTDANLWGGEFLVCDTEGFTRAGHFKYVPLPGGERAIKECWRTAISYILDCAAEASACWSLLEAAGFCERYGRDNVENLLKIRDDRRFSPLSSGAGRLFDAVAALTGICDNNTFEGEAAMALEEIGTHPIFDSKMGCVPISCRESYSYEIRDEEPFVIDFSKMILQIVEDIRLDTDRALISLRFHNALIDVITEAVRMISAKSGLRTVALSGGVFQNEYLLSGVLGELSGLGFEVFTNEKVPCNDAGISLGQAYILREKLKSMSPDS